VKKIEKDNKKKAGRLLCDDGIVFAMKMNDEG